MSEKILTIYDLSGIQNFIFSTQKLQDMIGASSIVHTALFENIPKMLGKENWEEESQNSIQAKLAYFAGGNFRHSKCPSLQERKTAAAKPSPSRRLSHPSPHQAQPKINRRRRTTK